MSVRQRLALLLLVVPVALAARWYGPAEPRGPRFEPRPDALEYAASAQALAQSGKMYLQVGPHQVRPRYPPGWPLLLAGAVRLGVPAEQLWRVTGLFGAALAGLLALLAAEAARALKATSWASFVAGLLAGWGWALAPVGILMGQTLLSDEPAAFVSAAGLALAGFGLLRTGESGERGSLALAAAGGLAFGLAASMRTVAGALMAPPIAIFFLGALRERGLRPTLQRAAAFALGAVIFPAITCLVLVRSGLPAWEWSGYRFWVPKRFGPGGDAFSLRYAFAPESPFRIGPGRRPLPHLEVAARVLLGIPGLRIHHYPGLFWPALGWLAAIPLWREARRREGSIANLAPWIAAALLLWTLAHVALFSSYFYPAGRFYAGPQALCLALLATACGVGLSRSGLRLRLAAGLAVALLAAMAVQGFAEVRRDRLPRLKRTEWNVRGKVARWREQSDEVRARRAIPFDPVHAQALGLLPPEVAGSIRSWGRLPSTPHVRRLRTAGVVRPDEIVRPKPAAPDARARIRPRRNR